MCHNVNKTYILKFRNNNVHKFQNAHKQNISVQYTYNVPNFLIVKKECIL